MVTMIEGCTPKEQRPFVHFLWANGLNAKGINKEMFPIYVGKCLSRKAVHSWAEKRGKCFNDDDEVETEEWKWLKQQSKDFYVAGFDPLIR
jgi:hypothetical protein